MCWSDVDRGEAGRLVAGSIWVLLVVGKMGKLECRLVSTMSTVFLRWKCSLCLP